MDYEEECLMRFKILAVSSFLVLAATGAVADEPKAQASQAGPVQSVTTQTPGFNDTTTGPTNPRGQVESPDWI
jgi:hypothetical protein